MTQLRILASNLLELPARFTAKRIRGELGGLGFLHRLIGVMQRGGRMPVGPIAPYTAEEGQQNADNSHNAVPRDARGRRIKKLSAAGETGAQQHHAVFYEGGCGLLILRCLPGQGPNTLLNLIQPHAIPDFAMFFTQQL